MSLADEQEILAGLEEELGCLSSGAPSPLSGPSLSSSQPLNNVHPNNNGSNGDVDGSLLLPPSCIQDQPGKRGDSSGEGEGVGEADDALRQAADLLLEEGGHDDQILSIASSASSTALAGLGEERRLGEGEEKEDGEREEGGSLCGDSHSLENGSGGNGIGKGKGNSLMASKSTVPVPPRPPPQPSTRKITMSLRPPRQRRAFDGYETSMNGGGGEDEDEDEENDEGKDGSGRRSGRCGSSGGRWGGSSAASRGGRSGGGGNRSGGVTRSNSNNSSSSSNSNSSANGPGPSATPFNSAVCKKRLYGPGRGRWKRRRFEGNGSMDDFTSE
ncbi:hypothetical protein VYU27_008209, partial [Nannochloropsis oceanica]